MSSKSRILAPLFKRLTVNCNNSFYLRKCLIGTDSETIDLTRNWYLIDSKNSPNGRFGRFERPSEFSALIGIRFGRIWRGSRFR